MSDVAQLGLAIDSSQIKDGTLALKAFADSAKHAQDGADKLTQASQKVGPSVGVIESMAKRAGVSFEEMRARIEKASSGMGAVLDASKKAADGIVKLNDAASKTGLGGGLALLARVAQGPLALALQAVTAAASAYFALTDDRGPKTEAVLEEQARLVSKIRDAYRNAADTAGKFYDQSKAVLTLQAQLNINELQSSIRTQIAQAIRSAVGVTSNVDILGNSLGTGFVDIGPKLEPFRKAIEDLTGSIADGGPAVERFRDAVAGIGNNDPTLKATAGELLAITQAAGEGADKLKDAERSLRLLLGTATAKDREALGLSNRQTAQRDPFESQTNSINRHIAAMKADAAAVDATAGEHARLRTEAQLLEAAQRDGRDATEAQKKKITELGQAARDAAAGLAQARVNSDISFGRQTALLSQDDVAIASKLKDLYGNDIPAALASTEASAMRANNSMSSLSNQISGGLSTALTDISMGTASAGDAFRNFALVAIRAIEEMIIKLTIVNPLMQALQGAFGGGGAGFGLLSGFGKLFAAADGGTFGPGWGVVGERGPELINVHSRGVTVIPNHISKPYLPGFAEGGMLSQSGNVTRLPFDQRNALPPVQIVQNIDARGADAAAVARLEIAVARSNRDLERNVTGIMAKHRANTPGSNR